MRSELPPIAKAAARVRATIELSVRRFYRDDRYSVGTELRNAAREIARASLTAWRDQQRQVIRVRELSKHIDNLKHDLDLAQDVNAFRSDDEFEMVAKQVRDLGKQCGGWLRDLENKGQNAAGKPRQQRAHVLSGRSASIGANP